MRLERQTVVATALRLLDQVGLDGLTLRRLATELDVQAPALYWHFANKQELLDQMAETLLTQVAQAPAADNQPWDAWLAEVARTRRRSLLAHRDGAQLAAGTGASTRVLAVLDQAVANLRHAGFSPAQALRALLAVHDYTLGFVLEEQADQQRRAIPRQQATQAAAALDHERYPNLAAALAEGGDPQGEAAFEFGLELLLHGLRATLPAVGRQTPTPPAAPAPPP